MTPNVPVELATDATQAEWDHFVAAAADSTLYHDYRWRHIIANSFGHPSFYLMARDDQGQIRGVLPLARLKSRLFGDFLVSLPYFNYGGVLAATPEARTALLEATVTHAQQLGVDHVELRHRSEPQLDWPAREDKVAMWLALPDSADALWKSFKSKLRAQIRRPEKAGATVRQGGVELLDDYYAVFARNMRDLGTPVYPKRFFRRILTSFAHTAKLFVVDLGGQPVAASLVLADRSTVEVPWASSLRAANRFSVNMLLYWAMLRDAADNGYARFDFGRSTRDAGTFRFKQQWGAEPEPLRWHYWMQGAGALPQLNPDNPKYRAAIALWQKLPLPVANLLGPRIVKNLP